jgi:hypothetical protein
MAAPAWVASSSTGEGGSGVPAIGSTEGRDGRWLPGAGRSPLRRRAGAERGLGGAVSTKRACMEVKATTMKAAATEVAWGGEVLRGPYRRR